MRYVLSLHKIVKIILIITNTMKMQSSEVTKTTTILVASDEHEKAFAEG